MIPPRQLLVTGSSGFVGRHVRLACADGGAFAGWECHGTPQGWDIRDTGAVNALVEAVQPDGVLHLAAQSFVPRSFEAPRETFEINLLGTLNLLQALTATQFNVSAGFFLKTALDTLQMGDFLSGVCKCPVFGAIIALVGCYFGLITTGGTEGVGKSTTRSVVVISISILIADFFLTKIYMFIWSL